MGGVAFGLRGSGFAVIQAVGLPCAECVRLPEFPRSSS